MDDTADTLDRRSRRLKLDKPGRKAALDKLRCLKGSKYKYEVTDVDDVWTDVDEREYSKMVRDRQDDDWIVDDDGQGYVEDGREIFDDECMKEENVTNELKKQKLRGGDKSKGRSGNLSSDPKSKIKDIKSMFTAMPAKKKAEKDVKLDDDNLLGDILQDLKKENESTPLVIKPTVLKRRMPSLVQSPRESSPSIVVKRPSTSSPLTGGQTPLKTLSRKVVHPRHVMYEEEPMESVIVKKEPDNFMDSQATDDCFDDAFDNDLIVDFESQSSSTIGKNEEGIPSTPDDWKQQEIKVQSLISEPNLKDSCTKNGPEIVNIKDSVSREWDELYSNSVEISSSDSGALSEVKHAEYIFDSTKLPLETNEKGEAVLRFFWIDAFEDYFRNPGVVYLFGKVRIVNSDQFVSCCVIVRDIERKLFVLPREKRKNLKTGEDSNQDVTLKDVHEEVNNLLTERFKIMRFRARKVTKRYCFDIAAVPDESDYLEVRYSAHDKSLPSDIVGETFSNVFGTNASSLEQLILDQHIMGPCWLEIKNPQSSNPSLSWCKVEVTISKPENVVVVPGMETPPLKLLAFGLKTVVIPKTQQNEIVAVSCLVQDNFYLEKQSPKTLFRDHFCAITRPSDCVFPFDFKDCLSKQDRYKVEKTESERALLGFLMAKLQKIDPDIIVGHDITYFDMDVLLHRLQINKIPNWSRIGRLRRTVAPKISTFNKISEMLCGRLLCDVKTLAKELIRSKSYDLTELTKVVLKKDRMEVDIRQAFNSSGQLLRMVECNLLDTSYCLQIIYEMNALPLALQITSIAGNIMSRTLLGGRSERNEYLLLHAFTEKGYIVPDKKFGKQTSLATVIDGTEDADAVGGISGKKSVSRRHKAAYSGGLVLEPKKGFYDKYILLMDFNSLYPSIIQEYNVCFTTIQRSSTHTNEDEECDIAVPDSTLPQGVLPNEIRKLVESRRQVKQLLKTPDLSPDLVTQYDIRQKALKLTANSMYGCLGFTHSRFYAKPLAAFITSKGREILLQTKELVQKINLDVIYGDTDSLMINTNSMDLDEVWKIGSKLKLEINKLYRHLEIEVDGVFKSMLLLKKKKYAALSVQKLPNGELNMTEEIKGVDIVRRDWSQVACEAGRYVIRQILSSKQQDQILGNIQAYLCNLKTEIMEDKISLEMLTITKQLTKNPEDYPDKKSQPHVNVAIRLNSKGGKKIKQGDTVAYVICEDGSNLSAAQRAYHLEELKANGELKIDKKYYLSQQIHPVVSRLCDPIDGLDAACIAECLGLDSSSYHKSKSSKDAEEDAMLGGNEFHVDKETFEDCEKFVFHCPDPNCGQEIIMEGPFRGAGTERKCVLASCPNSTCKIIPGSYTHRLCNLLVRLIRECIQKYYQSWLICDDPVCQNRTRKLSLRFQRGQPLCSACGKSYLHLEYTDRQLYDQICYYQHIFDVEKASKTLTADERDAVRTECRQLQREYSRLKAVASRYLDWSAYSVVDLTDLFKDFRSEVTHP